jgi:hypothetical protein
MPTPSWSSRGALATALSILIPLAAPACGGGDASPDARTSDGPDPEAPDARPLCYSGGGTPTPGAEVDVGAFRIGIGYAPLQENEELSVYEGGQGGHHFFLHARIRGMSPGDPDQPLETKPATWFSLYREDGTDFTVAECVYPLAYEMNEAGDWVLPYSPIVQFTGGQVPGIYGKRVRVKVEVMDGEGRYATDEEWVVAVPFEEVDAGVPDPAPDAGVSDAGVPDAATPGTADASVLGE